MLLKKNQASFASNFNQMHLFMDSFAVLLCIPDFSVKSGITYFTHSTNDTHIRNKITHLYNNYFPRLILSWLTLIILRLYIINSRLDFVSFDIENLQRQYKFAGEHDFPAQNSLMGPVQCLSLNRDQKFVASLVQSAIDSYVELYMCMC